MTTLYETPGSIEEVAVSISALLKNPVEVLNNKKKRRVAR
jgi:hypothetical protein